MLVKQKLLFQTLIGTVKRSGGGRLASRRTKFQTLIGTVTPTLSRGGGWGSLQGFQTLIGTVKRVTAGWAFSAQNSVSNPHRYGQKHTEQVSFLRRLTRFKPS